jgi:hypothetical protein
MLTDVVLASTTHLDLHYERMSRDFLESSAASMKKVHRPYLIDHDFDRQIGVVLNARVAELPDGEHGLFLVVGLFDELGEKACYETGDDNLVHGLYDDLLDGIEEGVVLQEGREVTSLERELSLPELLAIHLDSTKVMKSGEVYKVKRYIVSVGDLSIHVYAKDHPGEKPGHFHVKSKQRKIDARFNLDTLECMNVKGGRLKADDPSKIVNFFTTHPEHLATLRDEHRRLNE